MTVLAALLSLAVALFLAWNLSRLKEPPAFAYIALTLFAAVPVILLLKGEIARFAIETPQGKWTVKVEELARKVEDVQHSTENIGRSLATVSGKSQAEPKLAAVPAGTRLRITAVSQEDSYSEDRQQLTGATATAESPLSSTADGWWGGRVMVDRPLFAGGGRSYFLYAFRFERVQ